MNNKPSLLWLHPHFANWMGGHKYVFEVASRLTNNFKVTLASDILPEFVNKKFRKKGVRTITLSGYSTNTSLYWICLPLFIIRDYFLLKRNSDFNIIISSMFPMNFLAWLLGKPHYQICYEPYAFFYDSSFVRGFSISRRIQIGIIKFLYSWLDRFSTRKSLKIFTLSQYNKKLIKDVYNRNDAKVVYEGVDLELFHRRTTPKPKKYLNKKIIFHSTDFTNIKGTEYLVRALPLVKNIIPDFKLLITETLKNKSAKQRIIGISETLKVDQNIEFLGFVDLSLLSKILNYSDLVVQPSIGQSMNLTIKEGMSCGKPVITSKEGEEQFKNDTCGYLVDPHDTRNLAKKIIKLLENKKLALSFGNIAENIVKNKFSWESVTNKILLEIHV